MFSQQVLAMIGRLITLPSYPRLDLIPAIQGSMGIAPIRPPTIFTKRAPLATLPHLTSRSEATMSGLTFTEDAARHLARVYLTPDVVAQRAETMKQLALSPGERVLDIGCGPGFLCASIAAAVGSAGAVSGLDIASDLIAL